MCTHCLLQEARPILPAPPLTSMQFFLRILDPAAIEFESEITGPTPHPEHEHVLLQLVA